jgi:D-alanyl-lipoteichoic acid acyltransferase DltB (MBOAT superfamily)
MILGGLWHGAGWTFAVWGAWHGAGLAVHRWWQVRRGSLKPSANPFARFLRAFVTFHFVLVGWVFFRASNLAAARDVLAQCISGTVSFANVTPAFLLVAIAAAAAHYLPRDWYDRSLKLYCESPFYAQAAAMALLAVAIQYMAGTSQPPFIYSRF